MPYRLDESTGLIDYDALEASASIIRPKIIIAGVCGCVIGCVIGCGLINEIVMVCAFSKSSKPWQEISDIQPMQCSLCCVPVCVHVCAASVCFYVICLCSSKVSEPASKSC
jgi:hypothetical protein